MLPFMELFIWLTIYLSDDREKFLEPLPLEKDLLLTLVEGVCGKRGETKRHFVILYNKNTVAYSYWFVSNILGTFLNVLLRGKLYLTSVQIKPTSVTIYHNK